MKRKVGDKSSGAFREDSGGGRRTWEGGYIRRDAKGRDVFVIERWVRGKKFHVSTRCHIRRNAIKQLDRFEADPLAYRPEGNDDALLLSADLVSGEGGYYDHLIDQRKTSGMYAREMARHLGDWAVDLKGKNLRTLKLPDINGPLEKRTNRQHRIIALKGFFRWLREVKGGLITAQDITLEVSVPQAIPEKYKKKKVVETERLVAAFAELTGAPRDFLLVLAGTGMHVTELERFVRHHEASELVEGDPPVLITRHKSGALTNIPLGIPEVADAARRLRLGSTVPRRLNQQLKEACARADAKSLALIPPGPKCPPFTLGVLRHTVATFAVAAGDSAELVSKFLGHQDKRTTERFYVDIQRPTAGVSVPALRLVQG